MSREVIKYKFNRNHIKIYTIQNPERSSMGNWGCPRYDVNTTCRNINVVDPSVLKYIKTNKGYIEVKKESPLGFYYIKKEYYNTSHREVDKSSYRTINTVSYIDKLGIIHILTFYTVYGENKSARTEDGLRPWEICEGDNSMPDHMLQSLLEEVNSFFNEMAALGYNKLYMTCGYIHTDSKKDLDLYNVKKEVFEYLFGSIKGIRFQTDLEKIVSHGFDPKYSFRKEKEKK